jgi:hypothetical protein
VRNFSLGGRENPIDDFLRAIEAPTAKLGMYLRSPRFYDEWRSIGTAGAAIYTM